MVPKRKAATLAKNTRLDSRRTANKAEFLIGHRKVGLDAKRAYDQQQRDIEASDLSRYVENFTPIPDSNHRPWVRLSLIDGSEKFVGQVVIPSEHLKSSREYLELRKGVVVEEIHLTGLSIMTMRRYAQSISPKRLSQLPQYDFSIRTGAPETEDGITWCEDIKWSFADTIELYLLARELQDDHVCNLVLNHWRERLLNKLSYEVEYSKCTMLLEQCPEDFAANFWAKAVPFEAPDGQIWTDPDMPVGYVEEDDDKFHLDFHRCHERGHNKGRCSVDKNTVTESDYTLQDFSAIAKRTLLAVGWEEDDEDVAELLGSLTRDLYTQYSNASTVVDDSEHPALSISSRLPSTFQNS